MDRPAEKEKSSRKHSDRERDSTKERRDRDHKHRSGKDKSREVDDNGRQHRSNHRDEDDRHHRSRDDRDNNYRRSSREYSVDRERSHEPRSEREESKDRSDDRSRREKSREREAKRERSYEVKDEREDSLEVRNSSSYSHKRKDREGIEDQYDGSEKRARALDEKKGRRRFEDRVVDVKDLNDGETEVKREKRRFEDEVKNSEAREERRERRRIEDRLKEDQMEANDDGKHVFWNDKLVKTEPKDELVVSDQIVTVANGVGSIANGSALQPLNNMAPRIQPETTLGMSHPPPTKVSSISTTNENKGVNINRSHEVPGKSSTDGTASDTGKSGGLSLDALEKAKRVLQKQKEISEKLKNSLLLNKGSGLRRDGSPHVGSKESITATSSSSVIVPTAPEKIALATTTAEAAQSASSGMPHLSGLTTQKFEAVKRAQELAAKMGFRQDPEFAPLINMFPGQMPPEVTIQPKPAKAPVLRLDALGREIDEHGHVVNMPKLNTLSTLKVNINKQKKDAFQILKPELDVDPEENLHFDARMGINKNKFLRPKRSTFQFVEEGKWSKDAEIIKLKSQFGEAQAKELKAKQAQLAKAKAEPDINPNLIEVSERVITKEKIKDPIPAVEWWDLPLLLSGKYGEIIDGVMAEDELKIEKITIYVEHPRPIEPPAEPTAPPPQPLKLTKKERKKLRTQRRLAREKDRQEMIRQGLLEPPKPKVKMTNLMRVLGSEATQDPTKLEMEIRSAAAEREQAHVDRNIARKLTPAERREKKERKLFEEPSTLETIVSVYKINDLSHPQTRFKVDVNAQENRLTGCAVISDGISVVVVEGGNKSIKRYGKLMLRRIDWPAAVNNKNEQEDEEVEGKPPNTCVLVWQGSVAKPSFSRFLVQECRTEAAARKVFADAGVGHYWDLAVNFTEE